MDVYARVGLAALAVAAAVRYGSLVLGPFAVAAVLVALLSPAVDWAEARGLPRRWAAALAMTLAGAGLVLGGMAVVVALTAETGRFVAHVPEWYAQAERLAAAWWRVLQGTLAGLPPSLEPYWREVGGALVLAVQKLAVWSLHGLQALLAALPRALAVLVFGLAFGFLALSDPHGVTQLALAALPPGWRDGARLLGRRVWTSCARLFWASVALAGVTFAFVWAALAVAGAPYALLAAAAAGAFDLLPVLGPGLVLLPWAAVEALNGHAGAALALLLIHAAASALRWVLQSAVLHGSFGLHPAVALAALYVGAAVLGPAGLLAGPLFVVTVQAMAETGMLAWPGRPRGS
ncbi:MAG: AI-2E family transporter [Firmicutes bacterium]|nr:AI-2E family transporter [Bacillota bacterium]